MACNNLHTKILLASFLFFTFFSTFASANPRILALVKPKPLVLRYHKGPLLKGNVVVNLIWYGRFAPNQRSIILDFLQSLSPNERTPSPPAPSVASWWSTTASYKGGPSIISVGKQVFIQNYALGKSLTDAQLVALASNVHSHSNSINVVLTASDVAVEDFCMNRCGTHGFRRGKKAHKYAYAWVGNPATQCPGVCAWPFAKPIVGPQTTPLVAPNGDIGVDGMVINLATVLAGTVTNPFDDGYYQGPPSLSLEAVTACTGTFGSGAFPGYPGKVLIDGRTKAGYNAKGINGREYLLPAMWDPVTSKCQTLV